MVNSCIPIKIIISKLLNLDVKNELQINKHKLYLKKTVNEIDRGQR